MDILREIWDSLKFFWGYIRNKPYHRTPKKGKKAKTDSRIENESRSRAETEDQSGTRSETQSETLTESRSGHLTSGTLTERSVGKRKKDLDA